MCLSAAESMPRSTPEEQGISSKDILGFVEAAEKQVDALHSFMVVRHGYVVAEGWWSPYNPESPHELASLSKSFTSTAVGMAIAERKLSLTDPVLSFFPESAPENPSANLKAMRVRDLLIMSNGHESLPPLPTPPESWVKGFLAHPVPHKPGTHFFYDSVGSYMLSAIVQKVTGQTVLDYLTPRLFEPLGISKPTWDASPQGISAGGWGLSLRTEDIAKFGQLYLRKGSWHGRQLLTATWVEEATSRQTSNGSDPTSDWEQGYGYQFWRCRPGFYRGDGAYSQFCVVMPKQDAVLAVTAGTNEMQKVMNLMWEHFVPAMQADPLQANPVALAQLKAKLETLSLVGVVGAAKSTITPTISGRRYVFPPNDSMLESLILNVTDDGSTRLVWRFNGKDQIDTARPNIWQKFRFAYGSYPERACAASGAWTADDTFTIKRCAYETGYLLTVRLKFVGDRVFVDSELNVGTKLPQEVGKAD